MDPEVTDAMVEAQALVLFYQDELENLTFIASCDAEGQRATGDKLGRDMDRWESHPEHVKDRFRKRAREALRISNGGAA